MTSAAMSTGAVPLKVTCALPVLVPSVGDVNAKTPPDAPRAVSSVRMKARRSSIHCVTDFA